MLIAQAYPRTTVVGSDYHAESIEWARKQADAAGVSDRVAFEVATAQTFTGADYDLVTMFLMRSGVTQTATMPAVEYLHALYWQAHRQDPGQLRLAMAQIEHMREAETSLRLRRRLNRRLEVLAHRLRIAEDLINYDWSSGEAAFITRIKDAAALPGGYERWRAHGVPLSVLHRAGCHPSPCEVGARLTTNLTWASTSYPCSPIRLPAGRRLPR